MIFTKYSEHKPLTPDEEEYFHVVMCIENMKRAESILKELRTSSISTNLFQAALKSAIIEYAKPYTLSHGEAKWKYRLEPPPELNKSMTNLHKVLMIFRDKFIAHTDLAPKQGAVFPKTASETKAAIVSLATDPKLPDISDVLELVEHSLILLLQRQLNLSSSLFLETKR